ncbi:MAG: hypothetical protein ACT4P6_17835 [Gemmatimonadaceae bacterium]
MPQATILGTGGIPNLKIVEDHGIRSAPTFWFELHTQIEVPAAAATTLKAQLAAGNIAGARSTIMAQGIIDPRVNQAQLTALLNALFQV